MPGQLRKGRPPIGHDGKAVNLHHLTQREPGSIAEVGGAINTGKIEPLDFSSGCMMESFEKLKTQVEENADFVDVGVVVSDALIAKAESFLKVSFPESLRLYLKEWGNLAIRAA